MIPRWVGSGCAGVRSAAAAILQHRAAGVVERVFQHVRAMPGSTLDDEQHVARLGGYLTEIGLQNVESAQHAVPSIDVSELAGCRRSRRCLPQGGEGFFSGQKPQLDGSRDQVEI